MASTQNIKVAVLGTFALLFFVWLVSGSLSKAVGSSDFDLVNALNVEPTPNPDDYVGSETCSACHDAQFNSVSHTKHGMLEGLAAWKGKVVGCESCHGPGKAHVEGSGDITKIISFKNKNPKEISETCLGCHAGKEEHNNFRRGEHWRNNVGCTSCHTAHGANSENSKTGSTTLISDVSKQKPTEATDNMLKSSEPQLCIGCHTEVKAQFSKPFRHKVLEGTMKCSDCHNPHGGFELKQTKLSVGADSACVKCHANKQGPFVFEHAPLKVEGCATCHSPHGSANPKMLKRNQVRQLCLECHSSITEQFAPDVPSFHNQTVSRYQNCTICHAAIHGSNTSSTFFR
jgi:predicted CXXCH cytochrome family protein